MPTLDWIGKQAVVNHHLSRHDKWLCMMYPRLAYPDFVCHLNDGRTLAVEYKGGHLYDGVDAEEKRAAGAIWESRSKGDCLFVMPTKRDWSSILRKIGSR